MGVFTQDTARCPLRCEKRFVLNKISLHRKKSKKILGMQPAFMIKLYESFLISIKIHEKFDVWKLKGNHIFDHNIAAVNLVKVS